MLDDRRRTSRLELEDAWLSRVKELQTRYKVALEKFRRAQEEQADLANSDGNLALRQACETEAAALREYRRALEIFMALVIRGEIPPEE
jgi:hypothetical protein